MLTPISALSLPTTSLTAWPAIVLQDPPAAQDPQVPAEQAPSGGMGSFLLPMAAIAVVFWVVMIGPERKNRKKREAMLASLNKGDRVMTSSGIYGTITQVQGNVVTLAIADGVRVRFGLQAIQGLEEERSEEKAGDQPAKEKSG